MIAFKLSAAHLAEGDARTVVGVDVGCDLEDEPCKFGLVRIHHALFSLGGFRAWRYLHKAVEQLLHAKVVECTAEEHRCHPGAAVILHVKFGIDTLHQFKVVAQFRCIAVADVLFQGTAVHVHLHLFGDTLFVGGKQVELVFIDVIYTLELCPLVDGPRQWAHMDFQFLLQFVEQVKRVAPLTVHLVDENDDRRVSHAAHVHQLSGLSLHTLGAVHHDDGRIHSRQRAVSVFGKVLVTWCVENVDLVTLVVKLHHRGGYRDTTLFLDVHPVRGGCLSYLVALHGAGHLYLSAKEQEFLRQCGLARIRVRYNGKSSSSFNFLVHKMKMVFFRFIRNME